MHSSINILILSKSGSMLKYINICKVLRTLPSTQYDFHKCRSLSMLLFEAWIESTCLEHIANENPNPALWFPLLTTHGNPSWTSSEAQTLLFWKRISTIAHVLQVHRMSKWMSDGQVKTLAHQWHHSVGKNQARV